MYVCTYTLVKKVQKGGGGGEGWGDNWNTYIIKIQGLRPTKKKDRSRNDIHTYLPMLLGTYYPNSYRKTLQPVPPAPPFSYCTRQTPWSEAKV